MRAHHITTVEIILFTIWVVWLAQVQVIARSGRVVLGSHGELHAFDILFEVVKGSENVLHSFHAHALDGVVAQSLVSLHLRLSPGLSA